MIARSVWLLPTILVALAACGGRLEDGALDSTGRAPSSTEAAEISGPPLPEDGEWGTWQLTAIDRPDGTTDYAPPYIELDLHETGRAYLWQCTAEPTGSGKRCPYAQRRGCFVGSISVTGATWRVHFPSKDGAQTAGRGDIVDEPSGDISINGEGIVPAGGHYRRVSAASRDTCTP